MNNSFREGRAVAEDPAVASCLLQFCCFFVVLLASLLWLARCGQAGLHFISPNARLYRSFALILVQARGTKVR